MIEIAVKAVGVAAPGMNGWPQAAAVLSGERPYEPEELPRFKPGLLPPNERRRATVVGRLAFQAAEEVTQHSDIPLEDMAAVFASSGGDTHIVNSICLALTTPERAVSPTHFHNSVHNAPAGYWSIATKSRMPSTSLSAYDYSFAAGLMEAASMAQMEALPVLLVAYDIPPLAPLWAKRPIKQPFSSALILTPETDADSLCVLRIVSTQGEAEETGMEQQSLEELRSNNPAARALPLLQRIAQETDGEAVLANVPNNYLRLGVSVC